MRTTALALLALAGCNGDKPPDNVFDTADTGAADCGRVRGTNGVLMYDAADPNTVYYPEDGATDDVTTGIAGPVGEDYTFVAVQEGDVLSTVDGGCNWEKVGSLPDGGTWRLVAAGARVYAFDVAGGGGASSDDSGGSWAPFAGDAFVAIPTVSSADPTWLRGITAAGVETSTDGGTSWSTTGNLPMAGAGPGGASPGDLDKMVMAAGEAVWTTASGGTTWDDRTAGVLSALGATSVTALTAAISPDDANVMAALVSEAGGTITLVRSTDAGVTWQRLADSDGVRLAADSGLWIPPGASDKVLTVTSATGEDFTLHLNVSAPETGTHVVKTQVYDAVSQMAFSPGVDGRYLAGVSVK